MDSITLFAILTTLLPLSLGITFFKQLGRSVQFIVILCFFTFLSDIINGTLALYGIPNSLGFRIYTAFQFSIISLFFLELYRNRNLRLAIITFLTVFVIILIVDLFALNLPSMVVEPFESTYTGIIIIVFSLIYFYKIFNEMKIQKLEKNGLFWIVSGLLFYFSSTLVLFMLSNYVLNGEGIFWNFWLINIIANIILNIILTIGIWLSRVKAT